MSIRKLLDKIESIYRKERNMSYTDWADLRDAVVAAEEVGAEVRINLNAGTPILSRSSIRFTKWCA